VPRPDADRPAAVADPIRRGGPRTYTVSMVDVTDATFQTDVIERSSTVPVVVDLWAEWCGPCKQLGPILEKVVADTGGKVELAKVDIDANPQVAQAFRVQSIPAVFAIVDGRPVDQVLGAMPEAQVAEFVQKLLPEDESSELARLLAEADEPTLRTALENDPTNAEIIVALAELLANELRTEETLALLEKIPESPATRRVAALARTGPSSPADTEIRLLALLDRVKADEDARQQFVDLLELLPDEDPSKAQWRRKLTAQLF
jgi:putative thioredoxin